MSTLEVETEIRSTARATATVAITDCGRASQRTRGFAWLALYEGGIAPQNRLWRL